MANFDAIYDQIYNSLPDVEGQLKALQQNDVDSLTAQKDAQDKKLQTERDETLRQAYITQELNKRDLPAMMAAQGLTGGITETAATDILRDYRNSTNSSRKAYSDAYTDLSNTYDTNVAGVNSTYGQKIIDALAQKRSEAMQNAQIKYQIKQAEEAAWLAQQAAANQSSAGSRRSSGTTDDKPKTKDATVNDFLGSGAQGQSYTGGKSPSKIASNSYYDAAKGKYVYF